MCEHCAELQRAITHADALVGYFDGLTRHSASATERISSQLIRDIEADVTEHLRRQASLLWRQHRQEVPA